MKNKVLFTSHVANFAKFNHPYMDWFQKQGWEVHYASQDEEEIPCCDQHFQVDFARSPLHPNNGKAYFQLKRLVREGEYQLIHCHTPTGGAITRLAAAGERERGTKVLYTAHGFHFYEGAPRRNWLLYYNAEKYLARFTDCIITINDEDYRVATRPEFGAKCVKKIDGVGVDLSRFVPPSPEEKTALRKEYGYKEGDFLLLCVAEFTRNKNHQFLLESLQPVFEHRPGWKLLLAGQGEMLEQCKTRAKELGISQQVVFLGYRKDVDKLCRLSDVCVSAAYREGMPLNVIEAMASGLPVVCSRARGQVDLITQGENGFLFSLDNDGAAEDLTRGLQQLYREEILRKEMGRKNRTRVRKYSLERTLREMSGIYREFM